MILDRVVRDWRREASTLEAALETFNLKGGQPPATDQQVPGNSAIVADQDTAEMVFAMMRMDVTLLCNAFLDT